MNAPVSGGSESRLVAKNMAYLAAAQVLTIPLSATLNAIYARYLGAEDFGLVYLAWTMCGFAILVIEWGQQGVLPALIARDRSEASLLLGTSFAWRGAAACVVYAVMATVSGLLGHDGRYQIVLALIFVAAVLNSLAGGYKDSIRGLERTDVPAAAHVAQQLILFLLVVPVVLLGGRLLALLIIGIVVPLSVVYGLSLASRRLGITDLQVRWTKLSLILSMGSPFVLSDVAMSLQPLVDATFLSKLAPETVVGWYAVTRRLLGILILPATALIGSLYPTLCRLWSEDRGSYAKTLADTLSGVALIAVPAAVGCALYPEIGVAVFGSEEYQGATDNLRVMALFLFLVYFSLPIQSAVLAAGRQRAWCVIQSLCIVVSVALDPLLIRWFQERTGNGGVGLSVAAVASELLVVASGLAIIPRGVLNARVLRTVALALCSGAAMAIVAYGLKGRVSPFVGAPLAVLAYAAGTLCTGAITSSQRDALWSGIRRRLGRERRATR